MLGHYSWFIKTLALDILFSFCNQHQQHIEDDQLCGGCVCGCVTQVMADLRKKQLLAGKGFQEMREQQRYCIYLKLKPLAGSLRKMTGCLFYTNTVMVSHS